MAAPLFFTLWGIDNILYRCFVDKKQPVTELGANEAVGLIGLHGAGNNTFIKTFSGLLDSFQIETALWQDKLFTFREYAFYAAVCKQKNDTSEQITEINSFRLPFDFFISADFFPILII